MSFLNIVEKNVACERKPKGTWKRKKKCHPRVHANEKKNVLGTWESSLWWAGRSPNKIGFRKR